MYKVKPKELKRCKNWSCEKCDNDNENLNDMVDNIENEYESLINQYTVSDVDFEEKILNKLCSLIHCAVKVLKTKEINNDCHSHECSYISPDRFKSIIPLSNSIFTCMLI